MNTKKKQPRYSGEFRDRAVRLVEEQQRGGLSQWAAIQSVSQCVFRLKPITDSGASRSPIPAEADQ